MPVQQPDYVTFKSHDKTPIKFDMELIHSAGEKFVQASEQYSSYDDLKSANKEYFNAIEPELSKYKFAAHTARNEAQFFLLGAEEKLMTHQSCRAEIKQLVEQVNITLETYQFLLDNRIGADTHTRAQIFDLALGTLKNQTKGRQINIKNREYLENLGKCFKPIGDYQLFLNLIENALKYSPANSPIDMEFAKEIKPRYKEGYKPDAKLFAYYFIIQDAGIGIPPEEIEEVLTRGVRGSNTGNIQGTGMGLKAVFDYSLGRDIEITSPLYPDEPVYKGTRIKVKIGEERP